MKKFYITKKFLKREYINNNKKSAQQIANIIKCSVSVIYRRLNKYNIKRRNKRNCQLSISRNLGKTNAQFKDGRTLKKYYCIDCGKLVSNWKTKKCQQCYLKTIKGKGNPMFGKIGKNSPNWKGGKGKGKSCIDCGKELSEFHAKRCYSCANTGEHNPAFKNGQSLKEVYCIDCGKILGYYKSIRCKKCEMIRKLKLGLIRKNPNKPEKLLNKLLQKLLPNEYKFVGNWKFVINGFVLTL